MKDRDTLCLKTGDILILFLAMLVIIGLFTVLNHQETGNVILVKVKNHTSRYNLEYNQEIPLNGVTANGEVSNVLVIENGEAFMRNANCPDQVCVKHKPISKNGQMIVCLPNEIFIEVENNKMDEIDN